MIEKPILPKRPYKKREPKASPAQDIEAESCLLRLDERACLLMCVEYDEEKAAIEMGWDLQTVKNLLADPRSKAFLRRGEEHFWDKYSRARVNGLKKIGVTKGNIEARLMQLAMMDPADTKGSIEGQVKALGVLAEKFGYGKEKDPLEGKTTEELQQIVRKARIIEGNIN